MGKLIEVQLGYYRPVQLYDLNDIECQRDDLVILDGERASEFGRVLSDSKKVCEGKAEASTGKVLRKATEGDAKQIENNRLKAIDAMNNCERKVNERKLKMQIVKAEYSFDCSKIIFYFTAE